MAETEKTFVNFMDEIKRIEEEDSIYTSEKQIHRLLRQGSTYRNLNPFEVLIVEPETTVDDIRKQYKKLSILLHPDKNPDNRDKAQDAFDIVTKAYKILIDDATRQKALDVVDEAKYKVNQSIEEKKKRLRKDGLNKKEIKLDDEKPENLKQAIRVMTMKLFAEYERKRRLAEDRAQEERKRKRENEIEDEEKKKEEQEWNKNYEESREIRVHSWKNFVSTKKAKRKEFRPPKHKSESR